MTYSGQRKITLNNWKTNNEETRDFYLPKFQDIVRLKFWKSWTFPNFRTISVYTDVNFKCLWYTWGQNVLLQNSSCKNPGNLSSLAVIIVQADGLADIEYQGVYRHSEEQVLCTGLAPGRLKTWSLTVVSEQWLPSSIYTHTGCSVW